MTINANIQVRADNGRAWLSMALAVGLAAIGLAALLVFLAGARPAAAQAGPAGFSPAIHTSLARLAPQSVQRAPAAPAAPATPASDGHLTMAKTINTGTGDNTVAFNGSLVTYTIGITNITAGSITSILVFDQLPEDTLSELACHSACEFIFDTEIIPEPLGGSLVVTVTHTISWTIAALAPGQAAQLSFSGRVAGQADGTVFRNTAFASFKLPGDVPGVATLPNDVETTVQINVAQSGQPSMAAAPSWFSQDLGGTLSQDWGDFDNDGRPDLVLGSSIGATVYRNVNGRLTNQEHWSHPVRAYGVRWADFNGDGKLDLVVIGDSIDGTAVTSGTNYIFAQQGDTFVELGQFTSDYQLVRLAVGDFDGDGHIDIVASTNTINAGCPVRLFRNDGSGGFTGPGECVSTSATAAIGAGDFDNDDDLDLALGLFPNTLQIFTNDGLGNFTPDTIVDDTLPFLPYDLAWGDYDGNGFMDLAAAFPLQKEARIYRNLGGQSFDQPIEPFRTALFLSPLAVDWGDFNGDGRLDLVVADEQPRVYLNAGNGQFDPNGYLAGDALTGQVWSIRATQMDFGGNLNLALTNRDRPSLLFDAFASHLSRNLTGVDSSPAGSVAWGDANSNGRLDLLFGAGPAPQQASRLYINQGGAFNPGFTQLQAGLGPHTVAFGDATGNGRLDIAIGTAVANRVYLAGETSPSPAYSSVPPNSPNHVLAWGDANSDGRLDLLVGANGSGVYLYLNLGGQLSSTPVFITEETGDVRAIAWADFNKDHYMDFAVAFYNQPARVYLNNKNNTFTPVWNSGAALQTTSLAWADFNGDGYPDLALGHYEQGIQIFENISGMLASTPIWTAPTTLRTTALAWGDWDNDGDLDLAAGNNGQPDQVFANLGSTPGQPRLVWLWSSAESFATTGLAWGDVDGDGDLDLAISQNGGGQNGYYINGTHTPSHLSANFISTLALPNNPSYASVRRPGSTDAAYLYSSAEILDSETAASIPIHYTLYDPDGTRLLAGSNLPGDTLAQTFFEFSLDGGSTWNTATPAAGWLGPETATYRLGQAATFLWNAMADQAISDDARFRVRIVPHLLVGPAQRGSASAISPPFRIRATTCVWPRDAVFNVSPHASLENTFNFAGSIGAGTGGMVYTWNFGDGSAPVMAQQTTHTFPGNNTYLVTLTVSGEPCPVTRPLVVSQQLVVGTGTPDQLVYLPFIARNNASLQGGAPEEAVPTAAATDAPATASATATDAASSTPTATVTSTVTATPPAPGSTAGEPSATATQTAAVTSTATATPPAPGSTAGEPSATATVTATPESSATEPEPSATPGEPEASATPGEPEASATPAATDSAAAGPRVLAQAVVLPQTHSLLAPVGPAAVTAAHFFGPNAIAPTEITNSPIGINNEPVFNRNATWAAFWSTADLVGDNSDGNIEVFLAHLQEGGVTYTQVTSSTGSILGGFNLAPSIDDSGQRVAFFSDRNLTGNNPDSNFEIFLYDSSQPLALRQVTTSTKGFNILPSISGSGQFIAFASDRDFAGQNADGNTEIFRAHIGPGGTVTFTQVTNTPGGVNDQPRINHNGTRIAFVSNANLTGDNFDNNREVFRAEVGPGGQVTFTQVSLTTSGSTGEPSIDASGTRIAFLSDRDPSGGGGNLSQLREVFYADIAPNNSVTIFQVTYSTIDDGLDQPTISADGTRIGFSALGTQQMRLYDTLATAEISNTIGHAGLNPHLNADGTALIFSANRQLVVTNYPRAEVSVTKTVPAGYIFPDETLTYTLIVSNAGPSTAPNVIVTDTLPLSGTVGTANWTFGDAASSQGSCGGLLTGRRVVCALGPLPAYHTATITVRITPTTYGQLQNLATVSNAVYERAADNAITHTTAATPISLHQVSIEGPTTGMAHDSHVFTASVLPLNTSLLITFTWTTTGQPVVIDAVPAINHIVTYTWAAGGTYTLTVEATNPAGETVADTHTINLDNPAPTLSAIRPITTIVDGPALNLTLTGTNFVSTSQVLWQGGNLANRTYISPTSMTATVPAGNLTAVGGFGVRVFNPAPVGGESNPLTVTVLYSRPTLLGLNPGVHTAGGPTFVLTVTANNFVPGVTLNFGAQAPLALNIVNANTLTASVPASFIATAGVYGVTIINPEPNNGLSNSLNFTVTNPGINLTPNTLTLALETTATMSVTLTAAQDQPTLIGIASQDGAVLLTPANVTLPAGSLSTSFTVTSTALGGVVNVTATLPANLGSGADASIITVQNPTPKIGAYSPVSAAAGGPTFTLTITGTSFVNGIALHFGAQPPVAAALISSTLIEVSVPASYILTPGNVSFYVANPAPNSGDSGMENFAVISPTLTLTPSVSTVPLGDTTRLTATLSAVQGADRQIFLATNRPSQVLLPASVILLQGQTEVGFDVNTQGLGVVATITATLPGLTAPATATLTVNNPTPVLSVLHPETVTVGGPAFTLTITGTGFVPPSVVRWNGAAVGSPVVSGGGTVITTVVPPASFPVAGQYTVTVWNPQPPAGGLTSTQVLTVSVVNPMPTITAMSPATAQMGDPATTLVVTGTGFVTGSSQVLWNGAPLTQSLVVSSTRMTATVQVSHLEAPGTFTVTVENSGPGGGQAAPALDFTVQALGPTITQMVPTSTGVGIGFTLRVTGTNYVNPSGPNYDSRILWNGAEQPTTFISGTSLSTTISAAQVAVAGVYTVAVLNPGQGNVPNQLSNVRTFTVTNPGPRLDAISPTTATLGDGEITVVVTGQNFILNDSNVLWNNAVRTTNFISSTRMEALLQASDLETAGVYTVAVRTDGPGGGLSAHKILTVFNTAPTLVELDPAVIELQAGFNPTVTLTITGTGFVPGATIRWKGDNVASTGFVSSTQLTGTLQPSLFAVGGVYSVTVVNPAPPAGGVTATNVLTVTVYNPIPEINFITPETRVAGSAAITLNVYSLVATPSFAPGAQIYWNGSPRATVVHTPTQVLTAVIAANDVLTRGQALVTVVNPNPSMGPSDPYTFTILPLSVSLTPAAPPLTLTLPNTGRFTVTLGAAQAASTVVSLTSSAPGVASVPATILVPANTTAYSFTVSSVNTGTTFITAELPDHLGDTPSNSVQVNVVDRAISGLSASASTANVGQTTHFTATIVTGTNASYVWAFGDGSFGAGITPAHTYAAPFGGTYTATVTATNSLNAPVVATTTVQVNNTAPTITNMTPVSVTSSVAATLLVTGTNFAPGATVVFSHTTLVSLTTTYHSATLLEAALPGALSNDAGTGTHYVRVHNPAPPAALAARRSNDWPIIVAP